MVTRLSEYEKSFFKNCTFCDLFAGIGAFRLALESFGAQCVFSCEWDKDAQKVYEKNYGDFPFGDIKKIDKRDIPHHNILCAGFPCQPFSLAGKRLGFSDTRGTLFFDVVEIIKYHQPDIVLLENVRNIISHNGGHTLRVILSILDDLGYDVFYDVYNSADYGIPQKRERVFFVCFKKSLNVCFKKPSPVPLSFYLEDVLLPPFDVEDYVTHRDDVVIDTSVVEKNSASLIKVGIIGKGRQGERIYSVKGVSTTLSAQGGGVGARTGLYKVDNVIRRLAPRECARLMGFPETFMIADNKSTAYKQFGNSIVVDVIQRIILEIIHSDIL